MVPLWEEYSEKSGEIKVGQIDCTEEIKLCQQHGVRGYPSFLLYKEGEEEGVKFPGQRNLRGFQLFAADETGIKVPKDQKALPMTTQQQEGSSVVILGEDNFEDLVTRKDFFVKFYAPWCRHCQKMAPEWEALALDPEINVGQVDCTVHTELAIEYKIGGYPTIILFRSDGQQVPYKGRRNVDSFTTFWKENTKTELN